MHFHKSPIQLELLPNSSHAYVFAAFSLSDGAEGQIKAHSDFANGRILLGSDFQAFGSNPKRLPEAGLAILVFEKVEWQELIGAEIQDVLSMANSEEILVELGNSLEAIQLWKALSAEIMKESPSMLDAAGICMQLLGLGLKNENQRKKQTSVLRNDYERERVEFARLFLLQNLGLPPSIPELARISGINEFKLKLGFKEMFGQSIYKYLAAYRIMKARDMLKEGGMPVSEIAFQLGYASLQHFSAAFKKACGVPPSKFQ